jgi:hypothetical protein
MKSKIASLMPNESVLAEKAIAMAEDVKNICILSKNKELLLFK